ncbi:MAG: DUF3631 domain-containing protein [Pseudomonadota bacterium]|nr:DUF3631 domain-containing protein [Pseudomonadota bacterium]
MPDFNDVHTALGLDAVRAQINAAISPEDHSGSTFERLSKLDEIEYERVRTEEAERLGVRVAFLDKQIKNLKKPETQKSSTLPEIEAWHEPVDGMWLFQELSSTFKSYLALQQYQAEALSLWCLFSYCIDANNIAPKLLIYSPEKRCGKTTLLDVLLGLVNNPIQASNITPAALFRVIDTYQRTVVIDEADTFINDMPEINGIINSGHRRSAAYVIRTVGDNHEPRQFSTWAPTIIAMIGKPADTIVDRSIMIEMRRKRPDESINRFIYNKAIDGLSVLAQKCKRWVIDHYDLLQDADPDMPKELNDRATDNWRPLIAIAAQISNECLDTAYLAAISLSDIKDDEDGDSIGVQLLKSISDILDADNLFTKIPSADLLDKLYEMEDRPWAEWNRGKPITARQVAKHLKPFGITPRTIRIMQRTQKGYERSQFEDAFSRYLSLPSPVYA